MKKKHVNGNNGSGDLIAINNKITRNYEKGLKDSTQMTNNEAMMRKIEALQKSMIVMEASLAQMAAQVQSQLFPIPQPLPKPDPFHSKKDQANHVACLVQLIIQVCLCNSMFSLHDPK